MEAERKINEDLITRDEAKALLCCSDVTFWKFTRANKFPFYRAGRRMLFKKSEILESIRVPAGRRVS